MRRRLLLQLRSRAGECRSARLGRPGRGPDEPVDSGEAGEDSQGEEEAVEAGEGSQGEEEAVERVAAEEV